MRPTRRTVGCTLGIVFTDASFENFSTDSYLEIKTSHSSLFYFIFTLKIKGSQTGAPTETENEVDYING